MALLSADDRLEQIQKVLTAYRITCFTFDEASQYDLDLLAIKRGIHNDGKDENRAAHSMSHQGNNAKEL
jgi:hypothetical protein